MQLIITHLINFKFLHNLHKYISISLAYLLFSHTFSLSCTLPFNIFYYYFSLVILLLWTQILFFSHKNFKLHLQIYFQFFHNFTFYIINLVVPCISLYYKTCNPQCMAQPITFTHGAEQKNCSFDDKEFSQKISRDSVDPCADAPSAQKECYRILTPLTVLALWEVYSHGHVT